MEVITAEKIPHRPGLPGERVEWPDGCKFIWAYSAATLALGQPRVLSFDGDEETNPVMIVGADTVAVYVEVGVATEAITGAHWQWFQLKGDCDYCLVDGGTDVAKDDYLDLPATKTALYKDGAAKTADSVAIAREAFTGTPAAVKMVYLLGENVQIS